MLQLLYIYTLHIHDNLNWKNLKDWIWLIFFLLSFSVLRMSQKSDKKCASLLGSPLPFLPFSCFPSLFVSLSFNLTSLWLPSLLAFPFPRYILLHNVPFTHLTHYAANLLFHLDFIPSAVTKLACAECMLLLNYNLCLVNKKKYFY